MGFFSISGLTHHKSMNHNNFKVKKKCDRINIYNTVVLPRMEREPKSGYGWTIAGVFYLLEV